jgi:hypothetical protein
VFLSFFLFPFSVLVLVVAAFELAFELAFYFFSFDHARGLRAPARRPPLAARRPRLVPPAGRAVPLPRKPAHVTMAPQRLHGRRLRPPPSPFATAAAATAVG